MSELETRDEPAEPTESLLKSRAAVDQLRLSRHATQKAIKRSRSALRETLTLLVALSSSRLH